MVAEVDLREDAWEVLVHPIQRWLLYAVLSRCDDHQLAALAQSLEAVHSACMQLSGQHGFT